MHSNISQIFLQWKKRGSVKTKLTNRNHWIMLLMCQNTTVRVYGAWIKMYCALCSKTYNTLHSCDYFPVGSRQANRDARICEMSLLPTVNKCCSMVLTSQIQPQQNRLESLHKLYLQPGSGAISLTNFPSQIKCDGNLILLSSIFQ